MRRPECRIRQYSSHTFLYVVASYREQVGRFTFISIMRTVRLIGTTLLMVVLCLNFTACGDDDDDDPSNPLVGVWQNDEGHEHLRLTFNANGLEKSIYFMMMTANHIDTNSPILMIAQLVR